MNPREIDTPELRRTFAQALASTHGAEIRVEHEPSRRWVQVVLTRDGMSAWLLRVTGEHGQRYFDCGGRGVGDLDVSSLVSIVLASFRNAERLTPS